MAKKVGCSFQIGTETQRVSTPPPPQAARMGVAFKTGLVSLWHDEPGRLWGSGRCFGHAMLMLSLGRAIMGTLSCVGVLYLWHRNYSWNARLFFLESY